MSHFTVMVKIKPETLADHGGDVEAAVAAMLAPYDEQPDEGDDSPYMEFEDKTDEYREEYANKTVEMIRCPDGELRFPWDHELFSKLGLSIGNSVPDDYALPEGYLRVKPSMSEHYPTFEAFCKDWYNAQPQVVDGRDCWGHWSNPDAKWDWYQIGGRWSGLFPVRNQAGLLGERSLLVREQPDERDLNHADICKVCEIDTDAVAAETALAAEDFWARWCNYRDAKPLLDNAGRVDHWARHNVRSRGFELGLIKVLTDPAEAVPAGWLVSRDEWGNLPKDDNRRVFRDLLSTMSKEEFMQTKTSTFSPIRTYAVLDADGWHAPGDMGWWGVSSETVEEGEKFATSFFDTYIRNEDPNTTLVNVDCHI